MLTAQSCYTKTSVVQKCNYIT